MVEHQPRLLGSRVRFPAGAFAIFSVSAKASLPISFPFLLSLPLPFPFPLPPTFRLRKKKSAFFAFIPSTIYHPPIEHLPAGDKVVVGRFHFGKTVADLAHNCVGQRLQAGSVTHSCLWHNDKGKDAVRNMMDHIRARLRFSSESSRSRSTAGRMLVATSQDLSVIKQHQNDRLDRCTATTANWLIITTVSRRVHRGGGGVHRCQ